MSARGCLTTLLLFVIVGFVTLGVFTGFWWPLWGLAIFACVVAIFFFDPSYYALIQEFKQIGDQRLAPMFAKIAHNQLQSDMWARKLWLLAASFLFLSILAFVDQVFELPRTTRYAVLIGGSVAFCLGVVLKRCFTDRTQALKASIRRVERRFPELKNSLSTAFELDAGVIQTQEELKRLQNQQTIQYNKQQYSSKLYAPKRTWGPPTLVVALTLVVTFIVFVIAPSKVFPVALRTTMPFCGKPTLAHFEMDASSVIGRGEGVAVTVTPSYSWRGATPFIRLRNAKGEPTSEPISCEESIYVWRRGGNYDDIHYKVSWLWNETPWRTIRVVDFPALRKHKLTVRWPAYTRKKNSEFTQFGDVTLLKGCDMMMDFDVVVPPERTNATLRYPKELKRKLKSVTSTHFRSESIPCECSGALVIDLTNQDGFDNRVPYQYGVKCVEDQPPSITVPYPDGKIVQAYTDGTFQLPSSATDDYGLRRVTIREENMISSEIREIDVPVDNDQEKMFDISYDPTVHAYKMDDLVMVCVMAEDHCPEREGERTVSDMFTIHFIGPRPKTTQSQSGASTQSKSEEKESEPSEMDVILQNAVQWQMKILSKIRKEQLKRKPREQCESGQCQSERSQSGQPKDGQCQTGQCQGGQSNGGSGTKGKRERIGPAGNQATCQKGNPSDPKGWGARAFNCPKPGEKMTSSNKSPGSGPGRQPSTADQASQTGRRQESGKKSGENEDVCDAEAVRRIAREEGNLTNNLKKIQPKLNEDPSLRDLSPILRSAAESTKQAEASLRDLDVDAGEKHAQAALRELMKLRQSCQNRCDGQGQCRKKKQCSSCNKGKEKVLGSKCDCKGGFDGSSSPKVIDTTVDNDKTIPKAGEKFEKLVGARRDYFEVKALTRDCPPEFKNRIINYFKLINSTETNE